MNLLAGGGQEENILDEVKTVVTPIATPSSVIVDEVIKFNLWEKFQPYLLWVGIIVLLIIIYFVIRKLIKGKK
jgi:hypothetical protein